MQISVEKIGKKFVKEWIVRNATFELAAGQQYTFVGPNGSGKSTLLQLLTGIVPVSEGTIRYIDQSGKEIEVDHWYKHLVIAAPYLELIEEFTLRELIQFHSKFKAFKNGISFKDFEDFIQLPHASGKTLRHFSSGMKQRVKLGLAFMSDVPVIFLDEPTTNLDVPGINWYLDHVVHHTQNQLVLLGSNVKQEYEFCENIISVSAFK
ncbi:ABC transporter ATP-binding protein [Dyadobacter chenhuakuii]|uniref:ATP-binding cassette domain-containing protein n=1 Tax=Dyadobacter chenhuakuii TaxID=2909339 RepID=A0A9X1QG09_9BACT|nr:ATP-binding cassette domain-containing protein [Dyadobacter chenhuakuii]AIA15458.1 ABC transporter [uncultured bacterium]AIA15675.1 ABC transporter [uncultured bacterium]MCF2493785.1 ATP-binding cassette domain-containing protein [Dyadobacter chenhuakuii]MCF2500705.1 ATP-binding cassette domain-containing protein [Dyadobacter chenhuakuii]USJ30919.1 ATP-binding cassette domain-containing protein [Dyadobacter chenhuakuii]